ncbi:MAG: acyl-ACP--UDP-N-acetylglucosamine O-acyltransferase [Phycisphaerae bacterium]
MPIHPTAIISPQTEIDPTAQIGPYVVIDDEVKIGPNCRIFPHVFINGYTTIGANNEIHSGAVIGDSPQDLAFKPCRSYVRIGDNNVIREGATIHRGSTPESETVIGNHCYLMANSHIAHNCRLADHVKLANGVLLAGHVHIEEGSFLSGNSAVHQFTRIGRLCMISGNSRVTMDVPHFMIVYGNSDVIGINRVGLKRAGFTSSQITDIRAAYRFIWRGAMNFSKAVEQLAKENSSPEVKELLDFIRTPSKRGIAGPPRESRTTGKNNDEND